MLSHIYVNFQTLQDLMGADEIKGMDQETPDTLQRQKQSEAEKKRRKLEEDIQKEKEERFRKRQELLKREKEYEKVKGRCEVHRHREGGSPDRFRLKMITYEKGAACPHPKSSLYAHESYKKKWFLLYWGDDTPHVLLL